MFQKLREAEEKFNALESRLQHPDVFSNMEVYAGLIKEYRTLEPVILKYREYGQVKAQINEALDLLETSRDFELRELAAEELKVSKERLEILEEELKIMLLPHDPNDEKNIMVEIRGGAGGEEAALFAAGSTDMGDVATVIPAVHGYVPGAAGLAHGIDYKIVDDE